MEVRTARMKTNYKIIISGGILFVFGVYMMLNDSYRNYLFSIHPDLGIVGFLVSLSAGLVIAGIGLMLEFADRKYRVQK